MIKTHNDIPSSWIISSISEIIIDTISGSGFPKEYQGIISGTYPFAKVGDISRCFRSGSKYIAKADHYIDEEIRQKLKAKIFPKGTIVFPKIGEALKNNYRVICDRDMIFDNNVMGIVPDNRVVYESYLYYLLLTEDFGKFAVATAVPSIRRGDIEAIKVPLPPINEQKRIVSKIEELFSELDNGINSLITARKQLKIYRQAILKHAFEGKLTAAWREKNEDELESAYQLLERINQEREARYKTQMEEYITAVNNLERNGDKGWKPSKPKRPDVVVSPLSQQYLQRLPYGWGWFDLKSLVAESVLGKMLDKQKNTGIYRQYLRNINVRWGKFDLSDILQMRFEDHESERYGLKEGDLIICEGGEPGRCAVWKNEVENMRIQKALHRVRVHENIVIPEYLFYFIVFSNEIGLLGRHFTGTTIKHLTGESLANVEIPLCSIEEQKMLVKELESVFTNISNLENEINLALKRTETLRQSILQRAFSGKLVSQDPNDEPASVLLERIRSEKTTPQAHNKNNHYHKVEPVNEYTQSLLIPETAI